MKLAVECISVLSAELLFVEESASVRLCVCASTGLRMCIIVIIHFMQACGIKNEWHDIDLGWHRGKITRLQSVVEKVLKKCSV